MYYLVTCSQCAGNKNIEDCAVLLTTPFLDKFLWRHYFDSVSVILSNVSCVHHSDGIHSLEALKKFNFERIIVCKEEYFILYSDGR